LEKSINNEKENELRVKNEKTPRNCSPTSVLIQKRVETGQNDGQILAE
jgi:hypothetical protein